MLYSATMEEFTVTIAEEMNGARLDKALAHALPDISRVRLQNLIAEGQVITNNKTRLSASGKVQAGQTYTITVPAAIEADPEPQDIPLDIIYEDSDLLVINKAPGMVVHPAAGNYDGTLVNALLFYCGEELSGIGGVKRPGIVHRLDKETSGLMVVAKHDKAHQLLSHQLSDRSLTRVYHAFVWGIPNPGQGVIETQIGRHPRDRKRMAVLPAGGRDAVTEYKLRSQYGTLVSCVECRLKTGRTHQIRVHMAHIKHWLLGDPAYGRPSAGRHLRGRIGLDKELAQYLRNFPRQALHAAEIGFIHPASGKTMNFTAPFPSDMAELETQLKKMNFDTGR